MTFRILLIYNLNIIGLLREIELLRRLLISVAFTQRWRTTTTKESVVRALLFPGRPALGNYLRTSFPFGSPINCMKSLLICRR